MKTLILGYGFERQSINLTNYGKQLNDIKSLIVKRFNLTILQAHKIIKALNRKGKVIFNNGQVAFVLTIKNDRVAITNKLLTECKTYTNKVLTQSPTKEMRIHMLRFLNEIEYYENECSLYSINIIRLQSMKEYLMKVLNY